MSVMEMLLGIVLPPIVAAAIFGSYLLRTEGPKREATHRQLRDRHITEMERELGWLPEPITPKRPSPPIGPGSVSTHPRICTCDLAVAPYVGYEKGRGYFCMKCLRSRPEPAPKPAGVEIYAYGEADPVKVLRDIEWKMETSR